MDKGAITRAVKKQRAWELDSMVIVGRPGQFEVSTGKSLVGLAIEYTRGDDFNTLEVLLGKWHLSPDTPDRNNIHFPLSIASLMNSHPAIHLLMTYRASPNLTNKHNENALMLAARSITVETADLLVRNGLDPSACGLEGMAVHYAVMEGNAELADYLERCGWMDLEVTGRDGKSLLWMALKAGNKTLAHNIINKIRVRMPSCIKHQLQTNVKTLMHFANKIDDQQLIQFLGQKEHKNIRKRSRSRCQPLKRVRHEYRTRRQQIQPKNIVPTTKAIEKVEEPLNEASAGMLLNVGYLDWLYFLIFCTAILHWASSKASK